MHRTDIRLVVGTRPEAIKMAPLASALAARGLAPSLILTGQHPNLDLASFELDRFPAVQLSCAGQDAPHRHVDMLVETLTPLLKPQPDLVVVQGDTSSALGAALAAIAAHVPLAHVEAGLRSHDLARPWPEEEYRRRIDAEADLLFAPTETAARNLRLEDVRGTIHVTGNTGIDALLQTERRLAPPAPRKAHEFSLLVTCHRRENWGLGIQSLAAALIALASEARFRIEVVSHPNPALAAEVGNLLSNHGNIELTPPCGHPELIRKMRDCDLLLSDSGGMQEEAPALGTPMLVLREKTERPEAVESGNARLVGLNPQAIVAAVRELADNPVALAAMSCRAFPFGDGQASPRIASLIHDWLEMRRPELQRSA